MASILEQLLQPSLLTAFIGILVILGAPLAFHLYLASSSSYIAPPTVLLLGQDGAGKTSLLSLFERSGDAPAATHTSQRSHSVELNASTDSDSRASFRNAHDSTGTHTKFLLVDTPGHGKLRNVALGKLARSERLRAIVFVVDAAAIGEHEALAPAAAYLYDVLLYLQKGRAAVGGDKKAQKGMSVLIAANKVDLFTALPATLVRANLEAELTRIRATRSKGLLDSGADMDDIGSEEQDIWLGEYGSEKFTFKQMQEFDVDIEVLPGNVIGDGPGADKWWWWIAQKV